MNRIFLSFDKSALSPTLAQADRAEQFHNVAFGLLNIAFGTVVRVEFTGGCFQFTERQYSAVARISAIAFFVLASPFTIPLALAGVFSLNWSASFHDTHQRYERANQPRANIVWPVSTSEQYRADMDRYLGNRAPVDHEGRLPAFLETDKPMLSKEVIERFRIDFGAVKSAYRLRQGISQIVGLAEAFDSQIQVQKAGTLIERVPLVPGDFRRKPIVHEFFKFPLPKWEKMIADSYKEGFQENAEKTIAECRLDLIEALAEYESYRLPGREGKFRRHDKGFLVEYDSYRLPARAGSRRASAQPFLNTLALPPECPEAVQSILEEAKNTFKGQVWVLGKPPKYGVDSTFARPADPGSVPYGPYMEICLTHGENTQEKGYWHDSFTFLAGNHLHVDLFLNINQGGRLVLPATADRRRVILRCSGETDSLEHYLLRAVLYSTELDQFQYGLTSNMQEYNLKMEARAAALKKIRDSRGAVFMAPIEAVYQRALTARRRLNAEVRRRFVGRDSARLNELSANWFPHLQGRRGAA